jgi:hypothetical protein
MSDDVARSPHAGPAGRGAGYFGEATMNGVDMASRMSDPAARMALLVAAIERSPIAVAPIVPAALSTLRLMRLDQRDLEILRWIASHVAARTARAHA